MWSPIRSSAWCDVLASAKRPEEWPWKEDKSHLKNKTLSHSFHAPQQNLKHRNLYHTGQCHLEDCNRQETKLKTLYEAEKVSWKIVNSHIASTPLSRVENLETLDQVICMMWRLCQRQETRGVTLRLKVIWKIERSHTASTAELKIVLWVVLWNCDPTLDTGKKRFKTGGKNNKRETNNCMRKYQRTAERKKT